MKTVSLWLATALLAFGALAGATHFYLNGHPRRILVAVDTSYAMNRDWSGVARALGDLDGERYASFALVSDKGRLHAWSPRPDLPATLPLYAPRDFSRLTGPDRFPEIGEADRRILVTNAGSDDTTGLDGWEIRRPGF